MIATYGKNLLSAERSTLTDPDIIELLEDVRKAGMNDIYIEQVTSTYTEGFWPFKRTKENRLFTVYFDLHPHGAQVFNFFEGTWASKKSVIGLLLGILTGVSYYAEKTEQEDADTNNETGTETSPEASTEGTPEAAPEASASPV